jgi:putative ABC transport system substrate-binding protein
MRRRTFIMLTGGAAAWPLSAGAQQAAKLRRVAYLALLPGPDAVIVKERLAELGYIEGKNLIFDLRPPKDCRSVCRIWRASLCEPIRM